jgi:glutathione synthase/RimK-type ligase-like ATP-grasp enzyme
MQKMLILSRFVKEYEPKRLVEEGRKMGLEVDLIKYGQIKLGVVNGKYQSDLGKYDLVIPRAASKKGSSMVGIKTILLRDMAPLRQGFGGAKVLNLKSFLNFPLLGKMEQGVMLAMAGLPTVDFLTFGSKLGWREFKKTPAFNFPLIIKGRFGSHGRAVKLVNNWDEFGHIFQKYSEGEVLVQPKLTVKQWYRCVVVGREYLGEMRHRQKEKYGGEEGVLVKLNSAKMARLKEICLSAAALFDCDYAGIDVVWDEVAGDFKILEVNRTAQFKYFEKRTGMNVAEEIINFLKK